MAFKDDCELKQPHGREDHSTRIDGPGVADCMSDVQGRRIVNVLGLAEREIRSPLGCAGESRIEPVRLCKSASRVGFANPSSNPPANRLSLAQLQNSPI